jgi:exodeoxyribonuclease VII small subunit
MSKATPKAATSASSAPSAPLSVQPSFEEAIQRLGQIVEQLEQGELPLEQSLALFEEGVKLTRLSQSRLDAAERRVEELLSVIEEGTPVTRPVPLTQER